MNIRKLHKELYHHPPWPQDKSEFVRLAKLSNFTNGDIIIFARLYIKYSHIHCFHVSELNNYFQYVLKKMNLNTPRKLFQKTNKIYQGK